MHLSCANPQCSRPAIRGIGQLCRICNHRLITRLVPVCGFIPGPALSYIARELLADLKPTPSDTRTALELMRGTRHRQGPWANRPVYSAAVLHASPVAPMSRRLPHLLVGRRNAPQPQTIMIACVHYHLARHVLGLDHRIGLYLAGASFYQRRASMRPKGVRREYRGKTVANCYRLRFSEYVAIGRLAVKAAGMMGFDAHHHPPQVTTRYLQGVEDSGFSQPIVVHPRCGITAGSGDHPLDHFLPRPDYAPSLPRFNSKIRRASGKIAGRAEYPEGLDLSIEELKAQQQAQRQVAASRFSVKTTSEQPSTDWLFG